MKNKEKVAELIAALKTEIENDFELHRISVLEKDLLEGMPKVEVIDENTLLFNSLVFHKNKEGHFNVSTGLHRIIWIYHNGEIPYGGDYVVHHIDGNKGNNDISNLQLLTNAEHRAVHNNNIYYNKYICKNCRKTFYSKRPDGHSQFCSTQCWEKWSKKNKRQTKKCEICSKEFSYYIHKPSRCCSKHCAAILIARIKNERIVKDHERLCQNCGEKFIAKRKNQIFCSCSCSHAFRQGKKAKFQLEKSCIMCGKKFYAASKRALYCSRSCRDKATYKRKKEKSIIHQHLHTKN